MNAMTPSDLATTARDLAPLLREFREPFDAEVRKLIDANWDEICSELEFHDESEDLVVLISDAREAWPPRRMPYLMHSVLPRSIAASITMTIDLRVADWLAGGCRRRGQIDVVVELRGQLTTLRLEWSLTQTEETLLPALDETRSFTLWNLRRAQRVRYVFVDNGEAVATWSSLATLLGVDDVMLDTLIERADAFDREHTLSFTTKVRRGNDVVRCVRIDLVETFLDAVEALAQKGGAR